MFGINTEEYNIITQRLSDNSQGMQLLQWLEDKQNNVFLPIYDITNFVVIDEQCLSQECSVGHALRGRDKYYDICFDINLPDTDNSYYLLVDLGKTSEGITAGFEAMCYINNKYYKGVDSFHSEIPLPQLSKFKVKLRLWTGMRSVSNDEISHVISYITLAQEDKVFRDYYTKCLCVLDGIVYSDHACMYQELLSKVSQVDIAEGLLLLDNFYSQPKYNESTVHAIGHTHIDLAWQWRYRHTLQKMKRSFHTVVQLASKYPNFKFTQSQMWMYEQVKKLYPSLYDSICQLVDNGMWEVEGSMYVEADMNLVSGESIVRQIMLGKKIAKQYFGVDTHTLWLPDTFGYNSQMPQIMKLCGIDHFMTSKLSWNEVNKMPYDNFLWKGLDGSLIHTQFLSTPDFGMPEPIHYATYNGQVNYGTIDGTASRYASKSKKQLMLYGHGDGGGGVTETMIDKLSILAHDPYLPNVVFSSANEFWKHLQNEDTAMPVWDRELYLEFHRGTYTTAGRVKKLNRKLEYAYKQTEILATICRCQDKFTDELELGWKNILLNQFHDVLPGSSINEVYEDAYKLYKKSYKISNNVRNKIVQNVISKSNNSYCLVNTLPVKHTNYVKIACAKNVEFTHNGKPLLSQKLSSNCYLVQIPFKNMGMYNIDTKSAVLKSITKHSNTSFSTQCYHVVFDSNGRIVSLIDKISGRQIANKLLNKLMVYDDNPREYDAWDIDEDYINHPHEVDQLVDFAVEQGDLVTVVRTRHIFDKTTIWQEIMFLPNGRIDFSTRVDWQQVHSLLKAEFEFDVNAEQATFDTQFGVIKRNTVRDNSWDKAKFEVVGHKFADISNESCGFALLNDCKYGYGYGTNSLSLSLLRAPTYPSHGLDSGVNEFVYSIYPHDGSFEDSDTVLQGEMLNEQPLVYSRRVADIDSSALLEYNNSHIRLDAVIPCAEGYTARMHSTLSSTVTVKMTFGCATGISFVDCLGNKISNCDGGNELDITFKPYEIITIFVKN